MTKQIDLKKYEEFVDAVTSEQSKNNDAFIANWYELNMDVDMPRLLTASCGLGAEAGEFTEIVKKAMFQGKPMSEDNIYHMQRELGDVMWYWMQGCMALKIDPNEVIQMNIDKLKARYPGGDFDAYYSENRKDGDI
jgi:NTP pyrophosphatase (non-canonical NTP hydrolase)|tara:strand:- start:2936 stop:3343 length:408 start_codon:yes stop_codon:yes gene_type:complete